MGTASNFKGGVKHITHVVLIAEKNTATQFLQLLYFFLAYFFMYVILLSIFCALENNVKSKIIILIVSLCYYNKNYNTAAVSTIVHHS